MVYIEREKASNIRHHIRTHQVEIERKCVMMLLLLENFIDYVLGDDFAIEWLRLLKRCSSKLDFVLTEIDRLHYECRFYSSIFTHYFDEIPKMHRCYAVNGLCSKLSALDVNKEFKHDDCVCVIKCETNKSHIGIELFDSFK